MKFALASLNLLPETAGVYQFCDREDSILYIGKAKNLKKRVVSYFHNKKELDSKTASLVAKTAFINVIPVASEFAALLLEAKLIKTHQPKYNVIWKDDRHYIYIKITKEEFPRVLLSRSETEKNATFFGPFPSTKIVKDILIYLRRGFPYCTQNPRIKRKCFYTHLGLCNPCPAEIRKKTDQQFQKEKRQYLKTIKQLKTLLQGQIEKVQHYLQTQMADFAKREDFEQAAAFRERLVRLNYLIHQYQPLDSYIENPLLTTQTWDYEQKNLSEILNNYFTQLNLLKKIECYDISCIFGKLAVGSMVTFIDGQPAKNFYRRFRIKTKTAKSDFTMLKEIMERRLNHSEWPMPDLIVIDGGQPQLEVLKGVLTEMQLDIPMIGIVKRSEELVIPVTGDFVRLKLPSHSPALHLIQRIRDEAHRFAHNYHEHLRLRYLFSLVEMKTTLW